jgi:transposase InsO family protein
MMYPQRPEIHPPLAADFFGQLQALIDAFTAEYNHRRPHRSLLRHATGSFGHDGRRTSSERRLGRPRVR